MKKILIPFFIITLVLVIGLLIYNHHNRPFNENNVTKVDTHILNKSYSDTKSISTIINVLNSSKEVKNKSSEINSNSASPYKFTIYHKNGKESEINLFMTYGKDGQWSFTDEPSKVYSIPSKEVNKIYDLLQLL